MKRRQLPICLLTLAVAVVPFAATSASAGSATPGVATGATVRLTGTKPAIATPATRLTATPEDTPVQIGVTLRNDKLAQARQDENAIYTPGSPTFHHFLSTAEYDAAYSVDTTIRQQTTSWVTSSGMKLAFTSGTGDYYLLSGTTGQADQLFDVSMGSYQGKNSVYRASDADPAVPASLPVNGVLGLDSIHVSKLATPAKARAAKPALKPAQDSCPVTGTCNGFTRPEDLWSVYDQPDENKGEGQKIAIFGEGEVDVTIKSLRAFEDFNKLRHVNIGLTSVMDDYVSNDGTGEWVLDTQASTGMAPDIAEEDLYFGKDLSDPSTVAVIAAWAKDPAGPMQASASYGECEALPPPFNTTATKINPATNDQETSADETAYSAQAMRASMEGRTLFASTGDTGYGCAETVAPLNGVSNEPVPLAPYPAGDPNVVAVGGTVLFTDHDTSNDTGAVSNLDPSKADGAQRSTATATAPALGGEYGWQFSGGGPSKFIAMPAGAANYQATIAATTPGYVEPTCLLSLDGSTTNTGKPCKDTPDIAAQAGDIETMNGYALSSGGSNDSQGAGTSLSSPLSVGMWARIQAAAAKNTSGQYTNGFADYQFYEHQADFYDITTGPGNGGGHDTPGYDENTGLGTMDVKALMNDIDGGTAVTNPGFPDPIPDPLQHVCLPGGAITDPAGDATSVLGLVDLPTDPSGAGATNDPGLDITKAFITQDASAANLTFHIDVANLAAAVPPGQYFRYMFGYQGSAYYVLLERDSSGATTFSLIKPAATAADSSVTVLSGLTGMFNDAANEASVVVPVAAFNTKGMLAPSLAPGGALTDLAVLAQRPVGALTVTADSADSGGCSYTLAAADAGSAGTTTTTTTTATTPVTKKASKKVAAKKTTRKVAAKAAKPTQPARTLAFTGIDPVLPLGALVLLGGGLALRRRRKAC